MEGVSSTVLGLYEWEYAVNATTTTLYTLLAVCYSMMISVLHSNPVCILLLAPRCTTENLHSFLVAHHLCILILQMLS